MCTHMLMCIPMLVYAWYMHAHMRVHSCMNAWYLMLHDCKFKVPWTPRDVQWKDMLANIAQHRLHEWISTSIMNPLVKEFLKIFSGLRLRRLDIKSLRFVALQFIRRLSILPCSAKPKWVALQKLRNFPRVGIHQATMHPALLNWVSTFGHLVMSFNRIVTVASASLWLHCRTDSGLHRRWLECRMHSDKSIW